MGDWPYPSGVRVLCLHRDNAMPARKDCATHVFETITEPIAVDYAAGWIQAARCLVCGDVTPALDAEWWSSLATEGDVARCVAEVRDEIARLSGVVHDLRGAGASVKLRNFV